MIAYRPIPPLNLGRSNSWKSVLSAVVMAALLGTTAFGATESATGAGVQLSSAADAGSGGAAGDAFRDTTGDTAGDAA
ncbi:hypothetical protein [Arthrobacter sp. ISL-72]|uniref:hypothetical protein n=1 Tax=Arthrobacter sp. ISL-72 TaxID=2819114 RepID=UPI001BED3110|nr:hypothetical protein [Arthrobacter sp. ISL-72]MBT2597061.1 hypothetical protein [Arthrobacter sp. ISL-72]